MYIGWENCDRLTIYEKENGNFEEQLMTETKGSMSPLTVLIGIRRSIEFLKSNATTDQKTQLLEILRCESQPFELKPQ